jgi:lipopolysaccharide/colanic/teichoic acid biosynthesis glycosyltransferase
MTANNKIIKINNNIDNLKEVMIDNIDKAINRDEQLVEIDLKSIVLNENAQLFSKTNNKLKRKTYIKYILLSLILLIILLIALAIIITAIVVSKKS